MDKGCANCSHAGTPTYKSPCSECVASGTFSEYTPLGGPVIKDSGERREFESGAVRDIQEGKGRCDLLPLMQVAKIIGEPSEVIRAISLYQRTKNAVYLLDAIRAFSANLGWSTETAMLEVSKHFEAGCQKYGERNWEKGIPEHCYIDSAIRHYLKWRDGWTDEPHDRAVLWNLICLWWTHENITEVDDERVDV